MHSIASRRFLIVNIVPVFLVLALISLRSPSQAASSDSHELRKIEKQLEHGPDTNLLAQDIVTVNPEPPPEPAARANPSEIAAHPGHYQGKLVRVRGVVAQSLGRFVFTMENDENGPEVLVIVPALDPETVGQGVLRAEGEHVTIVGRVEKFYPLKFRKKYDWFTTKLFRHPDDVQEWEGGAVLVAHWLAFR